MSTDVNQEVKKSKKKATKVHQEIPGVPVDRFKEDRAARAEKGFISITGKKPGEFRKGKTARDAGRSGIRSVSSPAPAKKK